jgi:hypothetical protein
MGTQKGGKKGRKIGRNRNKPCMKSYTAARRWETNKAKRIKRHERAIARKQAKLAKRAVRLAEKQARAEQVSKLMRVPDADPDALYAYRIREFCMHEIAHA